MLEELLTLNLFGFFLIFARLGSALAIFPGFSAIFVSMQFRLGIALALSFVMAPVLIGSLPVRPPSALAMAILIAVEILNGIFFGTIARILMGALQTAGTLVAYVSSLANAMIQDPIAEQQSSTIAGFLLTAGALLIFATNLHHLMIRTIVDSYSLLAPGASIPVGGMVEVVGRQVADSFALGLQLAAPFIIVGMTYYIGLGLLGRLMPQLQVFFFGLPAQIAIQIWVLAITFSGIMMVFLEHFSEAYQNFILP
ncbi:MAG: flagellar biosynthetic protein FliR [Proteobacteria bacterium]|nr:flagellar biosynthetic protein FliR [Pseudomonadota bacterium]